MRTTIEHENWFARKSFGTKSSCPIEWQALKQIEQRLADLDDDMKYFVQFDPEMRMHEL
jgi:hypothetical protein